MEDPIRENEEADNASKSSQDTQPTVQAPAKPRRRPGKGKLVLLSGVIVVVILALVLSITLTVKATINKTAPTTVVQFSPDGLLLVSETQGSESATYDPHCGNCYPGLPDSYDVAYTVNVWNTVSNALLYSFPASANTLFGNQVRFSPAGRLLATSSTRLASNPNLWRIALRESQHGTVLRTIAVDEPFVRDFAFSPDGRLPAVATNTFNKPTANAGNAFTMIQLYDVATGLLLHTLQGWRQGDGFLFSPDSRTIAVGTNPFNSDNQIGYQGLKLYDVASGRLLKSFAPPASLWADVATFSKDGHALIVFAESIRGNDYYDLDFIDLASGRTTMSIERKEGHGLSQTAINPAKTLFAFSDWNDKSELASEFYGTGSNAVSLWDATTGKQIRVLEKRSGSYVTNTMNDLIFSPDGRLLAGLGADNSNRIWDVTTGKLLHTLAGYLSTVRTMTFSPDSRWLVTGSGYTTFHIWTASTIRIWDVQSGVSVREL